MMIIGGFASAVIGYVLGHATPARTARKRGWDGEPLGKFGRPAPAATVADPLSGERVLEDHA